MGNIIVVIVIGVGIGLGLLEALKDFVRAVGRLKERIK